MKNYRFFAAALAAVFAVSCSDEGARLSVKVADAPSCRFELRQLNGTATQLLDSVKTDAAGTFKYKVAVAKGQPEFVYLYKGDRKLASLLLEAGEKVAVEADTLGNYSVEGSAGSALLKEADDAYRDYLTALTSLAAQNASPSEIAKEYVAHYRQSIRFVMENSKSLAVIPVLYEGGSDAPVFGSLNDALIFRRAFDSLSTVYPSSKYVKALEKETQRRENMMSLAGTIRNAPEAAYPNLNMPGTDGRKVSLQELDAKLTLIWIWSAAEATHKIFNQDVLKPLYSQYASKGLEIYAVSVDADKALWAGVVKSQELPWINVNDGLGTATPALYLYNVQNVPAAILVSDKGIEPVAVSEKPLRAAVARAL